MVTVIKNWKSSGAEEHMTKVKNSIEGYKNRLNHREELINLKISLEITQSEKQKEKRFKKKKKERKYVGKYIWDFFKQTNACVIGTLEGSKGKRRHIFKYTENSPKSTRGP